MATPSENTKTKTVEFEKAIISDTTVDTFLKPDFVTNLNRLGAELNMKINPTVLVLVSEKLDETDEKKRKAEFIVLQHNSKKELENKRLCIEVDNNQVMLNKIIDILKQM